MTASEVVLGITYVRRLLTTIGLILPIQFSRNSFVSTTGTFAGSFVLFYLAGIIVIYILQLLDDFKMTVKTVGQNSKETWQFEIAFRQTIRDHVKLIRYLIIVPYFSIDCDLF